MHELAPLLPLLLLSIASILALVYVVLFFILYFHWKRFSLDPKAAKRFLWAYSITGAILFAGMTIGIIVLFL